MKNITISIILLLTFNINLVVSCKKSVINNMPMASITVTNAVISGSSIRMGSNVTTVSNNNFGSLNSLAGENDLYIWPVGDSVHPYYSNPKFSLATGNIYSLFVAGQVGSTTGVVVKDTIPYLTDSTCGVRIINLIPGSPGINVTLSTSSTVNEVSNLGYLQYTGFKIYPAKAVNKTYIFQFRKASDNTPIGTSYTYTLSTPYFANVTLAVKGVMSGTNVTSFGVIKVANDR